MHQLLREVCERRNSCSVHYRREITSNFLEVAEDGWESRWERIVVDCGCEIGLGDERIAVADDQRCVGIGFGIVVESLKGLVDGFVECRGEDLDAAPEQTLLVRVEIESSYDAKVAAAASEGPVEVGV